jgi:hypothetical protein
MKKYGKGELTASPASLTASSESLAATAMTSSRFSASQSWKPKSWDWVSLLTEKIVNQRMLKTSNNYNTWINYMGNLT